MLSQNEMDSDLADLSVPVSNFFRKLLSNFNFKILNMKKKKILLILLSVSMIFSCGVNKDKKKEEAYEVKNEEREKVFSIFDEYE